MDNIKILNEEGYSEQMSSIVDPELSKYRQNGYFQSYRGGKIFYSTYIKENARANIVICHGFTECSEKFNEMVYYYLGMNFNVFTYDHRGHGKSLRENSDPETVFVRHFDDYVKDLRRFLSVVVLTDSRELPCYLYAHSMGGAVAVRYLQEYRCDGIDKCVLTAPMISAKTKGIPHPLAITIGGALSLFGQGKKNVPSTKGFDREKTWVESNSTCPPRFDYWQAKRVANPEYQTARASNKWLAEAVRIIPVMMNKINCNRITIPVLLCQAEEDGSVNLPEQDKFIIRIPNGRLVKFENSRHEIYLSGSDVVKKYIDTIQSFLDE